MNAAPDASTWQAALARRAGGRALARDLAPLLPVFFALAVGLGHPLQDLNEGLYANVVQEMLTGGNWIVPSANGLPYLEKPPLVYWLSALASALLGPSEWALRVPALVGAALAVTAIHRFARRHLEDGAGLVAAWMFASVPLVIVLGRTLLFDALYAGLAAWAFALLFDAWCTPTERRYLRASAVCLALAVLAKGYAVLVIYAGVTVGLAATDRRRHAWRAVADVRAAALFLAIAAPWHVAAALREPGFAWFYFVNEHVLRFLGLRVPHDYPVGPWWHDLPRLVAYHFPWIVIAALPARPPARDAAATYDARRFLWIWLAVTVVFFSVAREKSEYYLLLATPALVLLLAERAVRVREVRLLAAVPASVLALLALAPALWPHIAPYRLPVHTLAWVALGVGLAWTAIVFLLRGRRLAGLATTAAIGFCAASLFSGFLAANADLRSAQAVAAWMTHRARLPVYVFQDYEAAASLPYYLGTTVGVVDTRSSDLWYGMQLHPDPRRFPTARDLSRTAAHTPLWLVVRRERLRDFAASPLHARFRLAHESARYLVYASAAPGTR